MCCCHTPPPQPPSPKRRGGSKGPLPRPPPRSGEGGSKQRLPPSLAGKGGWGANAIPKITDFGLAKLLDAGSGPTRSEAHLGTPSYMAPELAAGDASAAGPAVDVYSLGVMLYELLTGQLPFTGPSPLAVLEKVRNQEPTPPRSLRPSLSVDLETICLKCMEKEPGKRYASAEALAHDLRCYLDGEPIRARPIPAWRRAWRFARRRPAAVGWAVAVASLACLLLAGWSGFRAANQRSRHRAEQKYQQFVQHRNEAFIHTLLAPEKGDLFPGAEATPLLQRAESAIQEALALAGEHAKPDGTDLAPGFPIARKAEVAGDCYALLLVLAGIRGQQALLSRSSSGQREESKENYRDALRILDRAGQLGFQTQASFLLRARLLDLRGERQEAARARDQAALLPPKSALEHFLVGEQRYRRGEWRSARDSFNHALALEPGHFWSRFFVAVCLLQEREGEAARTCLNACIEEQPLFAWAYLFRSFANEQRQSPQESEADFQKAQEIGSSDEFRYILCLARGLHRFNEGDMERAAVDFRSARALKPERYNAYLNLAHVYLVQGRFAEAAQMIEAAIPYQPPAEAVAGYHLQRGRSLLRHKRYRESLQACDAALALIPIQPAPHEVRGHALLALGQFEQAERAFDKYLHRDGEGTREVFRGRARVRMKRGKYAEAVEDFTRAIERGPRANLYEQRGRAYLCSDAWKLAERDFSKAIELDQAGGGAWIGRGVARAWMGRYREAIADVGTVLHRLVPE